MKIKDLRSDVKVIALELMKNASKWCLKYHIQNESLEETLLNKAFDWSKEGINWCMWSDIKNNEDYADFDRFIKEYPKAFKFEIKNKIINSKLLKLYL